MPLAVAIPYYLLDFASLFFSPQAITAKLTVATRLTGE
jgi:hypothetical protein